MITSVMNKKIKHISGLNKRAKERRACGEFVVEGKKMFFEAPREWIREIYVSESFLLKEENEKSLEDYSYEVVQDEVFGKISATVTPQGILCILAQPDYRLEDLLENDNPLIVALEDLQDPGNLGTILRTGEGAGVTGILMTKETADIFNPKVIRATMGSIYRIPFLYVSDLKEKIVALKDHGFSVVSADLSGKHMYDEESYRDKTVFLIGNEGNGLQAETSDLANVKIRIPMQGEVESLNAAIATSILLYEANRQRRSDKNLSSDI